jgi:hypothetical protein
MNMIENLWREYLRAEHGAALPPEAQIAAQRHAFFTGAWAQLVFSRNIHTLDPASARAVNDALELELARAVSESQSNDAAAPATRLAV